MTWLCGLYCIENGLPAFVILTREAGEGIRFIHDPMPLIMPGIMLTIGLSQEGSLRNWWSCL